MIELVCVFSRSFFLKGAENRVIRADEGALAAGNYFIVTMGMLPCFLVGHCLLKIGSVLPTPRFTLSKSSPPSSPVFPTVRGPRGGTAKSPGRDGTAPCSPFGAGGGLRGTAGDRGWPQTVGDGRGLLKTAGKG